MGLRRGEGWTLDPQVVRSNFQGREYIQTFRVRLRLPRRALGHIRDRHSCPCNPDTLRIRNSAIDCAARKLAVSQGDCRRKNKYCKNLTHCVTPISRAEPRKGALEECTYQIASPRNVVVSYSAAILATLPAIVVVQSIES
jgi:hypothetical protein